MSVSKPYIINHILHLKIYGYGYKDINQLPAVEADVVQVVLGRVDLTRILLCLVALSEHALLPELGVVVKVQLGVGDVDLTCLIGCLEGVNRLLRVVVFNNRLLPPGPETRRVPTIACLRQRVDLDHGGVGLYEHLVQLGDDVGGVGHSFVVVEPHVSRHLLRLRRLDPLDDVDRLRKDQFRCFLGHVLNRHPPRRATHHDGALGGAVEEDREVPEIF